MTEHTPGPWVANTINVFEDASEGSGGQIADCAFFTDFSIDMCSANARLIAAAPDLLEALMEAVGYFEADYMQPDWMPIAEAAIRKAKGDA